MRNKVCRNCKDRYIGCHSACDSYIEECKLREEEKEKRRKAMAGNVEMAGLIKEQKAKNYNRWRAKHRK